MKKTKFILFILLLLIDVTAFAFYGQHSQVGLGNVAGDLLGPLGLLRHLFNIASLILGVVMLISGFSRYLRYRKNPQESPLSTVLLWFFLGLVLIAIPLLHYAAIIAAQKTGTANVY